MARKTQDDWVTAALRELQRHGIEAVRIEALAAHIGVTKGSFYHHFSDRSALLEAMLDEWERLGTDEVITLVNQSAEEPRARLRRLLAVATQRRGPEPDLDTQLRAWATHDDDAAQTLARIDAKRVAYTVTLLEDLGLSNAAARHRAAGLYRMLIGEYAWRSSGGAEATEDFLEATVQMVTAPET